MSGNVRRSAPPAEATAVGLDRPNAGDHQPRRAGRDVVELRGGEISTILEIALTDAPNCILKVYPAELHWKMAKEVYVHGLLRDADIPVPRILLADDTRSVIDLNFMLMSKLDGIEFSRRDPELSELEQFAIFAEMGALAH